MAAYQQVYVRFWSLRVTEAINPAIHILTTFTFFTEYADLT